MVDLNQYRVAWTGLKGAPGVSTFYSTGDPSLLQAKLITFFTAIKAQVPTGNIFTVPNTGHVIDSGTGQATATWAVGTQTAISCTGTGNWSAPTGQYIRWGTSLFSSGRNLTGKTFLVPLVSGCFNSNGGVDATWKSTLTTAAGNLTGGTAPLVIWSRKTGVNGVVTSATVPDKAVVLRSRRD